jgi:NADH-quinone oxidoreductase subunit H
MQFDIVELLRSLVNLTLFDYLRSLWGAEPWVELVLDLMGVITVSTFSLLIVIFLIWFERKIVARLQDRIGPNRVGGRYGLLQTVADVAKLLTKEDIIPAGADKIAFNVAPLLAVMASLMLWAVIPFAPGVIGTDLNIGIFYIVAISSVSIVPILLAGWSSNNKYALLGAFRSVAQLVSYEVPMIMALLVPILLARTMSMQSLIAAQDVWFILVAPLAALIFFVSALAELGRTPFDLIEAESEIVAGFHTEYTGMKFALFFAAEFISTLFMSALFTTVFLGGWRGPFVEQAPLLGMVYFFAKTMFVYFIIVWVRGTLPRVRIDHMMDLNWKFLVPLSVGLIFLVALVDKFIPAGAGVWGRAAVHFLLNAGVALVALEALRRVARRQRAAEDARRRDARGGSALAPAAETHIVATGHH